MQIDYVSTPDAPQAIGPYSQGVKAHGFVYTSGQIALDPATGNLVNGSFEEQVHRVLKNLEAILKAAGSDLGRVLKMTVYVSDMGDWGAVNETYARVLGEHRPARAVVPARELHYGFLVEIEAVAAVG